MEDELQMGFVPAADVNDDLAVNSMDVILMRRHIVGGYGVELKASRLVQAEASQA